MAYSPHLPVFFGDKTAGPQVFQFIDVVAIMIFLIVIGVEILISGRPWSGYLLIQEIRVQLGFGLICIIAHRPAR